ncbi:hypothetical protein NC651_026798 [Populus alba x Populus x berolinensis]|nr:hypothetical protein NC651_026798 [Populus alba x Populus x berolinensis]
MCFIFNVSASCSQVGYLLSHVRLGFRRRRVLAAHEVFNLPQLFSIGALHSGSGVSGRYLGLYNSIHSWIQVVILLKVTQGQGDEISSMHGCFLFRSHACCQYSKQGNIKLLLPPVALNRSQDKFRRVANNMDLVLYYGYNISLLTFINAFISIKSILGRARHS